MFKLIFYLVSICSNILRPSECNDLTNTLLFNELDTDHELNILIREYCETYSVISKIDQYLATWIFRIKEKKIMERTDISRRLAQLKKIKVVYYYSVIDQIITQLKHEYQCNQIEKAQIKSFLKKIIKNDLELKIDHIKLKNMISTGLRR